MMRFSLLQRVIGSAVLVVVMLSLVLALPASSLAAAQYEEFVVLVPAEAGSLDPLRDFSVAGLTIHAHMYEPLIDYEGPGLELTPKLAETWRVIDDYTWEFSLRKGVTFHNGQPFTAEDVKWTLEAAADPKSVRRGYVTGIEEVQIVDSHTVRIKTAEPDAALLARLAYIYILPKAHYKAVGESRFGREPAGTGFFKLVEWVKDERLVLEVNPDYWGQAPSVERLVLRPVPEAATRIAELSVGGAHLVRGVPVEMAETVETDPRLNLVAARGVRQVYYPLNTTSEKFSDVRVRQAINYAVDREAIVEFILQGHGDVRWGPLSALQPGANPDVSKYTYDPAKAKQLLAEAGYPNGLDVTWNVTRGAVVKDLEIAEAVAHMLGQVGIRVNLVPLESAQLLERYYAGDFEMSQTTWSLQADLDTVLSGLRVESTANNWFANDEVDSLLRLGRSTLDPVERAEVYKQLHSLLFELSPWLTFHAQDELYGVAGGVDWQPYPFAGNAGMTYLIPMP